MAQREGPPAQSSKDPLQELLQKTKSEAAPPHKLSGAEVTFPQMLSDSDQSTTALAAVKDERGRLVQTEANPGVIASPEIALPEGQLPAGDLLHSTKVTTDPKDDLTEIAARRLSGEPDTMAPPGSQGGYEIQVASFPDAEPADAFVAELRKRGHRAYRQAAYVPERGLWHRVRIGSFKAKYEASAYQRKLEGEERLSTFLVDPETVKRQEAIRDAKQEARDRKLERKAKMAAH
jgi:cell division septation protein DedD